MCIEQRDWILLWCNWMYFHLVSGDKIHFYSRGEFDPESHFFTWHMIKVNQMSPAHDSILYSIFFLLIIELITYLASVVGKDQHSTQPSKGTVFKLLCLLYFGFQWFWPTAALASLKAQISTFPDDQWLSVITSGKLQCLCNSCSTIMAKGYKCDYYFSVLPLEYLNPARVAWVFLMTRLTAPYWCLNIPVDPK